MSAQDTEKLVRLAYELYNQRDFARSASLTAPDAVTTIMATGQQFHGPEGTVAYLTGWATAFPDSTCEITNVVASETGAVVEFIGRGTHTGPLATPAGSIPPSGRKVEFHLCDVWTVRDGKYAGNRDYFDLLTLLTQIGAAAPPAIDITTAQIGTPVANS
ncbi:MAG TPA: ester cyclase [Longimicrobiaceae bacterium]